MLEVLPGSKTYRYISEEAVIDIIKECEKGSVRRKLSEKYKISPQTISDIAAGRSWGYLPRNKIRWNPCHILSDANVEEIRKNYKEGRTQKEIACNFNVNPSTISRIISKLRRREVRYA